MAGYNYIYALTSIGFYHVFNQSINFISICSSIHTFNSGTVQGAFEFSATFTHQVHGLVITGLSQTATCINSSQ